MAVGTEIYIGMCPWPLGILNIIFSPPQRAGTLKKFLPPMPYRHGKADDTIRLLSVTLIRGLG